MSKTKNPIGWLTVSGNSFDIGNAMGEQGRAAVHSDLVKSDIWATITASRSSEQVGRMMQNTRSFFPEFFDELKGLAHGLQVSFDDVFAWNCRGDILASVPDGCTTVQTPGKQITVGHNEDGLPFFRGQCFILDARPTSSTAFRAFCYPGSLAGHTFGWNDAGLIQAVNNLRLQNVNPDIPRMVLGRAVLASLTLAEAFDFLTKNPICGGFHMTLAQSGNPEIFSVEYGRGHASVRQITGRSGHANHALHLDTTDQIITKSSEDRQGAVERLVAGTDLADIDILRDTSGPGLPIRRDDPNDPDDENTLATCLFSVSNRGVEWKIFGESDGSAAYQGKTDTARR